MLNDFNRYMGPPIDRTVYAAIEGACWEAVPLRIDGIQYQVGEAKVVIEDGRPVVKEVTTYEGFKHLHALFAESLDPQISISPLRDELGTTKQT